MVSRQAARRIGVLPVGGIVGGVGGVDGHTTRSRGTVVMRLGCGSVFEHTSRSVGSTAETMRGMKVGIRGGAGSVVGVEAGPSPSSCIVSFDSTSMTNALSPSVPAVIVSRVTFGGAIKRERGGFSAAAPSKRPLAS